MYSPASRQPGAFADTHHQRHLPRQRARSYAPSPSVKIHAAHDAEDPWAQMATTYAWVVEQQLDRLANQTEETRRWVVEQQISLGIPHGPEARSAKRTHTYPQVVVENRGAPAPRRRVASNRDARSPYGDLDAEIAQFAARTRETRRLAQRQEERNRLLQEEFGRMEARWRERSERTERRIAEERRRADEQHLRAQRSERWVMERMAAAWRAYEEEWAEAMGGDEPLTFRTIPWPVLGTPRDVDDITDDAVARFVLSPAHSQGLSQKERVRNALRRWHPDRFGRLMVRVAVSDKARVEAGVGAVARCLNEMMETR